MATKKAKKTSKLDKVVDSVSASVSEVYEMMLMLKPLIPEDVREKDLKEIASLVDGLGGTMQVKDNWGKKHLAYKINGHEEGYYIIYALTIDPAQISELERELSLINNVLRFMILKESQL